MSRIPKSNINTPFLHIMSQGINKESIFKNDEDKKKYLTILKNVKDGINLQILVYCIMTNHVHLLIFDKDTSNVSKFMHKVNSNYARYYNKKYNRVGYVFRDRYKAQPIYSEQHLLTCIKYIHNNPVKAGMCNMPEHYKYSSYNYNIFESNERIENEVRNFIENSKPYKNQETFAFLEDEFDNENNYKATIEKTLSDNNLKIEDLENCNQILKTLVYKLKNENKISYRKMEEILKISRKKLAKL